VDFEVVNDYTADPETVFALFGDAGFLRRRYEALGHTKVAIEQCGQVGDVFVIGIRRTVPVTVPGYARKVLTPRVAIEQTDEWGQPDESGIRSGTYLIAVVRSPISLAGSLQLRPSEQGCEHVITGTIRVPIPIIGRKLSRVLRDDTLESIRGEHEFGLAELEAHP
jgi:hypothetical protein